MGSDITSSGVFDLFGFELWVGKGSYFSPKNMESLLKIQERLFREEWQINASVPLENITRSTLAKQDPTVPLPLASTLTQRRELVQPVHDQEAMDYVEDDELLGNDNLQDCLFNPAWLKERTLTIEFNYDHTRTSVSRDDVLFAIANKAGVAQNRLIGLDPIDGGSRWEVVCKSLRAKKEQLAVGNLQIGRYRARFTEVGKELVSLRVHWLPLRVPNDEVVSWALDTFAEEVLDINFEKMGGRDGQQVMSFVRTLTVILREGCDKETDISYRFKFFTSEGAFTVLISVKTGGQNACVVAWSVISAQNARPSGAAYVDPSDLTFSTPVPVAWLVLLWLSTNIRSLDPLRLKLCRKRNRIFREKPMPMMMGGNKSNRRGIKGHPRILARRPLLWPIDFRVWMWRRMGRNHLKNNGQLNRGGNVGGQDLVKRWGTGKRGVRGPLWCHRRVRGKSFPLPVISWRWPTPLLVVRGILRGQIRLCRMPLARRVWPLQGGNSRWTCHPLWWGFRRVRALGVRFSNFLTFLR